MGSILYNYTPKELQTLLDNSSSYCDVLEKVGLNGHGRNPETLKKIIKQYELDETILNDNRRKFYQNCAISTHNKIRISTQDIIDNKKSCNSSRLLKRLVDEGYKKYMCEICGISEWNNNHITLQLHHIDGNHSNNNLSNLQILCPNCHSQTDTYCGKSSNKSKEKKVNDELDKPKYKKQEKTPIKPIPVSREELKYKIRNNSFVGVGLEYGVTDNAVRKWCDRYELPRKKSDIKKYSNKEWNQL